MRLQPAAVFSLAVLCAGSFVLAQNAPPAPPAGARGASEFQQSTYTPTAQEYAAMNARLAELNADIAALKKAGANDDLIVDAESCAWQGYNMINVPGAYIDQTYVGKCTAVINDGIRRAQQIKAGTAAWPQIKGRQVNLGYRSRVDGAALSYHLMVPASYDPSKPTSLYVYLHGRSHIDPDLGEGWAGGNDAPGAAGRGGGGGGNQYIRLEAFGRANNSYVWAGETDVLETIAAVQHRFNIDPNRILLSGFSLGGAGGWQTGLHYPDMFCGLEIDAGVIGNRLTMDGLNPVQRAAAANYGMMVDHAINVLDTPLVGYAGANDAQLASSTAIRKQLTTLGYTIDQTSQYVATGKDISVLFLANPGQGHSHATGATAQLINAFDAKNFATGRVVPDHIKYVTYTTQYNHDFWITVDGMGEEFSRAYVDATRDAAKATYTIKTENVSRLLLDDMKAAKSVSIDGDTLQVTAAPTILLVKDASHWKPAGASDDGALRKQPGLQGPVNAAFLDAFICVSPTGTPFSAATDAAARKELSRFTAMFLRDYLGDTRARPDTAVTDSDIANNSLVLFGDPGSNTLIARIVEKLPIKWTKDTLVVNGKTYNTADSMPVLIYPNPLNPKRYVVINAGLSAGGRNGNAYGDWAVLRNGAVADGGVFDSSWKFTAGR